MTIRTTARVWREGKNYIAHALPLDVSSAGTTPAAALEALREAIGAFVATARDQGTLDQILEECGYVLVDGKWVAPQIVTHQYESLAPRYGFVRRILGRVLNLFHLDLLIPR